MSSFVISTNTTAGQDLDLGEFGFVAPQGSILSPIGSAVVLHDTATLTTYGALAAATANGVQLVAVTDTSVTVAATGSVVTGGVDLAAIGGSFTGFLALHNAGAISGGQGIALSAATGFSQINIANDGTLQGLGVSTGAALALELNLTSAAIIANTGTLSTAGTGATVSVTGQGTVTLTNSGHILNASALQAAIAVDGALTLRNTGLIEGNVSATQSANIFNSGDIEGNITLNAFNDVVRVSGVVMGDVTLGNGVNAFWLTGGRVMGRVLGGAGADSYHIDRPDVTIVDRGGGLDRVYASADFRLSEGVEQLFLNGGQGLIGIGSADNNLIVGDAGDDTLRGSGGADSIAGGAGFNRLYGGTGADTLTGGDEDDQMFGGMGNDLIRVGFGADRLYGGLGRDTISFDAVLDPAGVSFDMTQGTARFLNAGALRIAGFEVVRASSAGDRITGGAGNDALFGLDGADRLSGGASDDTLVGGAGADTMAGGAGADVFLFQSVTDSAPPVGIDRIEGFEEGHDLIDLRQIDAVLGGSDNAFAFIGSAAFTGTRAELRYALNPDDGTTLIELRLAGSVSDDMRILLGDLISLSAQSFAF